MKLYPTTKPVIGAVAIIAAITTAPVVAQVLGGGRIFEPPKVSPLGNIKPVRANTRAYIKNRLKAAQLGKALFWDLQAGSDGQACASCHFHAGADIRLRNQVNPGGGDVVNQQFDQSFVVSNDVTGPNKIITSGEFPFMQTLAEKNDRMGSQGTFAGLFVSSPQAKGRKARVGAFRGHKRKARRRRIALRRALSRRARSGARGTPVPPDQCNRTPEAGNPFHPGGTIMYRKVEPRQTPSAINAAFNIRQFWDGRARNIFNGVDPFGAETNAARPDAGILVRRGRKVALRQVAIANASLASQAVGPPLSDFEMSCAGRIFADIGRRLIHKRALAGQHVHPEDSLFSAGGGKLIPKNSQKKGLRTTYLALIKKAFRPKYWSAKGRYTINEDGTVVVDATDGYTQMEHNFSLFWGLAIMEYERLLISNDSPFDRGRLSAAAERGKSLFVGRAKCGNCHSGPLFSNATTERVDVEPAARGNRTENMRMGDGSLAIYDSGFYNIGVRPTVEDRGLGGEDPWGNPLSKSRSAAEVASNRDAVEGSFKVPILRNVAQTPPYMHNGGLSSLMQVVEFYDRGGRRKLIGNCDTTGLDPENPATLPGTKECSNLAPDITQLDLTRVQSPTRQPLTKVQKRDLVAFLRSLTDRRVACHSGIFDHPSLPIPDGQQNVRSKPNDPNDYTAKDIFRVLPATGVTGLPGIGKPCFSNTGNLFGALQRDLEKIAPAPEGFSYADPQNAALN